MKTANILYIALLCIILFSGPGLAEANTAPITNGTIPDQTVTDLIATTVDVSTYFSDPESDALTYTVTSSDTAVATVSVSNSTISITAVAAGTATLTVTATDPGGLSVDQTLSVSVNRYPVTVGTIPDQTLGVRGGSVTVDVSSYFSDPDAETLTYSVPTADSAVATLSMSNATLTITPVAAGSKSVSVSARDPGGLSVTNTFSVSVVENRAPVTLGTISDQTLQVDGTFTVDTDTYFSDPDGDTLSFYYWSEDTSIVGISSDANGVTYTALAAGTASVKIRATDPGGLNVSLTFSITVEGTPNSAPVAVGTIPDQTVDIGGDALSLDVSSYFSDPDGDPLSYAFDFSDSSKMNASVTGSTVLFTGVAAGTVTVTVTVTDTGELTATQTFTLTVVQPNRAPVFSDLLSSTVDYPENGTISVASFVASDPDSDPLTYSVETTGDGEDFEFTDTSSPELYFKSAPDYENPADSDTNNTYVVTVKATDSGDLSDTHTVTITVTDVAPPAKMTAPTVQFATESNASDMLVTFEEPSSGAKITFFEIRYRAGSTGDYTVIRTPAGGVNTTVTVGFYVPLKSGVTYQVQVRSESGEGLGDWSDTTEATMNAENTNVPDPADALPAASSELAASLAESVSMGTVIFNELRNASTDTHDWIELRNVTDTDVDLNDWTLMLVRDETQQALTFPAATVLPANGVLLLRNTETAETDTALIVKGLILPQAAFTLLLQSPSGYEDVVGNSFLGDATVANLAPLTVDQTWYRIKPAVIGYRTEAWMPSSRVDGTPEQREVIVGDVNADGIVNILDLVLVASQFGETGETPADVNGDGTVNVQDLVSIANAWNDVAAAP